MTIMWERHQPKIKFSVRAIVTHEAFAQMPAVRPDPRHWTERLAKTVIETDRGPRWHIVDVQRHNGLSDHIARPVSIRPYQPED